MKHLHEQHMVVWVSMNISEEMAKNYVCLVKFKHDGVGLRQSVAFVAHSVDTPFDTIFSSKCCGIYPYWGLMLLTKHEPTFHNGKLYKYKWKIVVEVQSRYD